MVAIYNDELRTIIYHWERSDLRHYLDRQPWKVLLAGVAANIRYRDYEWDEYDGIL